MTRTAERTAGQRGTALGRAAAPMLAIGVTGTDTGVGKTVIAAALAAALTARGRRVGTLKPVETGVAPGTAPGDAARLRAAAGAIDALDVVCPYVFAEPLAPMVAAERAGRAISLAALDAAYARVARGRNVVIVEGAGGLTVPILEGVTFEDLCVRWGLDLVVVAANRLGVINHTTLTVRSAEAARLRIAGLVLNAMTDTPSDVAELTNLEVLQRLLPRQRVVSFPFLRTPDHIPALADSALAGDLLSLLPIPIS